MLGIPDTPADLLVTCSTQSGAAPKSRCRPSFPENVECPLGARVRCRLALDINRAAIIGQPIGYEDGDIRTGWICRTWAQHGDTGVAGIVQLLQTHHQTAIGVHGASKVPTRDVGLDVLGALVHIDRMVSSQNLIDRQRDGGEGVLSGNGTCHVARGARIRPGSTSRKREIRQGSDHIAQLITRAVVNVSRSPGYGSLVGDWCRCILSQYTGPTTRQEQQSQTTGYDRPSSNTHDVLPSLPGEHSSVAPGYRADTAYRHTNECKKSADRGGARSDR